MSVYDCFTFYNELDILELRLAELNEVVDTFVLVEATRTHSGNDKPLVFSENRKRYGQYLSRIWHVIVEDLPDPVNGDRWIPERHQRRCIARALRQCKPSDLILVSDVDEIPAADDVQALSQDLSRESAVLSARERVSGWLLRTSQSVPRSHMCARVFRKAGATLAPSCRVVKCLQRLYQYYLNGHVVDNWRGTTAIRFSTLFDVLCMDTEAARMLHGTRHRTVPSGWHFSYVADPETIVAKIRAFAHSEFDTKEYTDVARIEARIDRGENLFDRQGAGQAITYVAIDDTWPSCVLRDPGRWAKHVRPVDGRPLQA